MGSPIVLRICIHIVLYTLTAKYTTVNSCSWNRCTLPDCTNHHTENILSVLRGIISGNKHGYTSVHTRARKHMHTKYNTYATALSIFHKTHKRRIPKHTHTHTHTRLWLLTICMTALYFLCIERVVEVVDSFPDQLRGLIPNQSQNSANRKNKQT